MTYLTSQDTQRLSQEIQLLYGLRDPETFGYDALNILARLVPVGTSSVMIDHPVHPHHPQANAESMKLYGLTPDIERHLIELMPILLEVQQDSPFMQNLSAVTTGAHKFSDFVTQEQLQGNRSAEILEHVEFDDHMLMTLTQTDANSLLREQSTGTYFYFYRNWSEWTERDRLVLNLLQPHLMQAYQTVQEFQQLHQQMAELKQSVDQSGIILLDRYGQIQQISAQAVQWLRDYFSTPPTTALSLQQLPERLYAWFTHQLTQLHHTEKIMSACLPLRLQQGDRQLNIRLVVDSSKEQYSLLLSEERMIPIQTAFQLLGLTHRESEVLWGVVQGLDNQAISAQMEISVSTVRKHLEKIYSKLNVQSRTQAANYALEKLGLLNSNSLYL